MRERKTEKSKSQRHTIAVEHKAFVDFEGDAKSITEEGGGVVFCLNRLAEDGDVLFQ